MSGNPLLPTDPRVIGSYSVQARLGAGGMGTVYLARDRTGAQVAVKVLHQRLAGDPQFLARFAAEAAAARRVAGFCTARVLDADVNGPQPYLVTEFVKGPTLHQVLARQGRLAASQVEALGVGVAAALTAIHAAGVVHRDLKPSNVLLSGFGPKVIDFGVAMALDSAAGLTSTGVVFGTPGWMAPEQLRGAATAASDVFVWALLMVHAGAGWPAGATGGLPTPADLALLPAALAEVVTAALNPEPTSRPAARELLLRLCGSADPGPVRTATAVLSHPWAPAYTAAAIPGPPRTATPPAPSVPVAPRRRRWYRRKRFLLPAGLLAVLVVLGEAGKPSEPTTELPALTARDGILEFTVTGLRCGQPALGAPAVRRTAQGQLCTVQLRVRNFGTAARRVSVGNQQLHDRSGRTFDADRSAWMYLPEAAPFFHREINPGNELTATLVYDIAPDAVPATLEVHDAPLSGGASITLEPAGG